MKNLSSLLQRISAVLNRDDAVKGVIIETIKEKTEAELGKKDVSIRNGVLEIEASPIIKSELMLREESLLQELREVHKIFISRILYK